MSYNSLLQQKASSNQTETEPAKKYSGSYFVDNRKSISSGIINHRSATVQRAVHESPFYPLNEGKKIVNTLNRLIPKAVIAAKDDLVHPSNIYSARYNRHRSAATWGNCVETQLNLVAPIYWIRQHRLDASRPDYYASINNKTVYVDLTTERETAPGGMHITEKLRRSKVSASNVEAADITYFSKTLPQIRQAIPKIKGRVTKSQRLRFALYHDYLKNPDVDYDEGMDKLKKKYKYISGAGFTFKWNVKERKQFSDDFHKWVGK